MSEILWFATTQYFMSLNCSLVTLIASELAVWVMVCWLVCAVVGFVSKAVAWFLQQRNWLVMDWFMFRHFEWFRSCEYDCYEWVWTLAWCNGWMLFMVLCSFSGLACAMMKFDEIRLSRQMRFFGDDQFSSTADDLTKTGRQQLTTWRKVVLNSWRPDEKCSSTVDDLTKNVRQQLTTWRKTFVN